MTRRLSKRIVRVLRAREHGETVHFHAGPAGRPYACHDTGCQSPALDPADV